MKPSSPHALALPLEEARSLLTRQLLDGEGLQVEAKRLMGRPQLDRVGALRMSVMNWSDSSEHVLRRIFGSSSVPDEFARKRRAWRSPPTTSAEGILSNTLGEIDAELKALHGILSMLPEVQPGPQASKSADVVQSREPRRTYHAVQSTSIQDLPAEEDLLGFRPYVEALAAFLANERTQPPLTLSIEGEWGSGKSSFMLQLEAALRRELKERVRFIRFNAWRHDKEEALWSAFALEFSRQLMATHHWFALPGRWLRRLRLGGARLRRGQGWLSALLLAVPLLTLAAASWVHRDVLLALDAQLKTLLALVSSPLSVPIIQKIWKFFGNPFSVDLTKLEAAPSYESRIPFLEQFHEDFRLLMASYASPAEKIFVFIDDLDRCEVPKSAELLQALNLMIPEDSRVIFILGVDREKVAAGIAIRHEKLLPLVAPPDPHSNSRLPFDPLRAAAFGRDFLERFIQLPFQLPRPVPERLDGLLDHLLGVQRTAGSSRKEPSPEAGGVSFWPTASPETPLSEEMKAWRAAMLQKVETDSPEVREVVKRLAPALEFNLRRLKQFLNVFRLSIYIANHVGLFDPRQGEQGGLTLSQLGKFVAIGLRWPELLDDLEAEPELISELEDPKRPGSCLASARWRREPALLRLLQAGLEEGEAGLAHSLRGLELRRLRSVASSLPRKEAGEPSSPTGTSLVA